MLLTYCTTRRRSDRRHRRRSRPWPGRIRGGQCARFGHFAQCGGEGPSVTPRKNCYAAFTFRATSPHGGEGRAAQRRFPKTQRYASMSCRSATENRTALRLLFSPNLKASTTRHNATATYYNHTTNNATPGMKHIPGVHHPVPSWPVEPMPQPWPSIKGFRGIKTSVRTGIYSTVP